MSHEALEKAMTNGTKIMSAALTDDHENGWLAGSVGSCFAVAGSSNENESHYGWSGWCLQREKCCLGDVNEEICVRFNISLRC